MIKINKEMVIYIYILLIKKLLLHDQVNWCRRSKCKEVSRYLCWGLQAGAQAFKPYIKPPLSDVWFGDPWCYRGSNIRHQQKFLSWEKKGKCRNGVCKCLVEERKSYSWEIKWFNSHGGWDHVSQMNTMKKYI